MKTEEAYNQWASQYDTNLNKTRDLDQKKTREILKQYDFKNVLELGCGSGKNTTYFAERAQKVIAIDFSEKMLNLAQEKINLKHVHFKKANLLKIWPVEDSFADLISVNLVLEHIQDLNNLFQQVYRKLNSKGLFYISELHPFKQYIGSKARFEVDDKVHVLETFTHHISDFIDAANFNNLSLVDLQESFDEETKETVPRLIHFVFQKY
ncbi:class I SAM-dependent DNA methyltransferase [Flavobacteriaceae bacterium 14752]|uniref:class I SAM-dependent DNA methyltransferase n=1 Tax=Mesohalobacter salilacus TaxID=2491711 RepID=UPI000F62F8DF|nr:class I SAM-dependent methyltransferase [Flavobacteriaceae bacterium 14752]